MPVVKNNSIRSNIDISRVHYLERTDKVMVIDRITGRWVMLPAGVSLILPLLSASEGSIPDSRIENRVEELAALLFERGIGIAPPLTHNTLNTVILKLTKACNLACTYCYDFEPEDRARHMQGHLAMEAMFQAIDMAEGKINFILHGGEPMLVWDLIETLVILGKKYGQEKGIEVQFIGQTNLTRLDRQKVDFSLEHDIHWGISFDGPADLTDKFRIQHNGKGSYNLLLKAIREYPEFISRCNALSTITAINQDKLVEIATHVRELGFPGWDWSLFQPIGRGRNYTQFELNIDSLIDAWNKLFDEVLTGRFNGFFMAPILKYLKNFLDGPGNNMCMRSQCGAARDLLSINFDGTIESCDCIDPCSSLANLGHVNQGGLLEAYQSPKADLNRSRNVEALQCGSCLWQAVCGGTCMARAGGVDKISKAECLLSLNVFDRISESLSTSDALLQYKNSCYE